MGEPGLCPSPPTLAIQPVSNCSIWVMDDGNGCVFTLRHMQMPLHQYKRIKRQIVTVFHVFFLSTILAVKILTAINSLDVNIFFSYRFLGVKILTDPVKIFYT